MYNTMRNPKPLCKYRRKKCVWSSLNDNSDNTDRRIRCARCLKLDIECIPQSDSSDEQLEDALNSSELMAQDGDPELRRMLDDMNQLQVEMQQYESEKKDMEKQMFSLVTNTTAKSPSLSLSSSPSLSTVSSFSSTLSPFSFPTILATTTGNKNSKTTQEPTEWKLSIIDGSIRLNTPIRTIDELMMFTQASLRYLSPFTGLFKQEPVRFEATCISPSLGLATVLQRSVICRSRKKQQFDMIRYNSNNTTQLFDYRNIMNYLLPLYFKYVVPVTGLVHAPTFWKHYQSLDDPFECPIALATSIDALVSLRNVIDYTPIQRRTIADFFYSKCKDLLFDLYENPDSKLDVIMVTCLLQTYLTDVLLNAVEARRLLSVALLLCLEMEIKIDEMTDVQRILLKRHHMSMEVQQRSFDMLFEDKIDFAVPDRLLGLEYLDDEPEKTKMYVRIYNHIFRFIGSPYISEIMGQVNGIFYGEHCEIYLEDLLRYEPIVLEWWNSLPSDLQLCENPFDPEAYKLVGKKLSPNLLFPFTAVHLMTAVLTSSVLKPQYTPSPDNAISIDVMRAVREKLMSLAHNSSKVLIHSLKVNWAQYHCDTPSFSLCVIIHVLYCLEKLGHCTDTPFPFHLLSMIKENFNERRIELLPVGHEVPSSASLLVSLMENPNQNLIDLYGQYPLPGYAMLSDVLCTSFSLLDQHLRPTF
ncbi:hypothetical protein BDC45DRAFT_569933 [Circinella umbellata]|nr:hypothetical protein BDC45DRAFT_569933 [Circinella umbellata]